MLSPDQFARAYARNAAIIAMQAEGLSHEDSLLQTPYNINCLNWVIGHVVDGRDQILQLFDGECLMSAEQGGRYRRESDPITEDGPDVLPLASLLEMVATSQERLAAAVSTTPDARWSEQIEVGGRSSTLASRLLFGYFHDTYHTGQTDLLRQVAGTNDKLI